MTTKKVKKEHLDMLQERLRDANKAISHLRECGMDSKADNLFKASLYLGLAESEIKTYEKEQNKPE